MQNLAQRSLYCCLVLLEKSNITILAYNIFNIQKHDFSDLLGVTELVIMHQPQMCSTSATCSSACT